jgi:hypothetical protein
MEHKAVEDLLIVADVHPQARLLSSRRERLERWAECLAADPKRRLKSLGEIEFTPKAERPLLRADNSPITVAFQDPVLRAAGLEGDRLGDAMAFFELTERQAHRLLCSCLNGWSMEAGKTAARVQRLAHPDHRATLMTAGLTAAVALPFILYVLS